MAASVDAQEEDGVWDEAEATALKAAARALERLVAQGAPADTAASAAAQAYASTLTRTGFGGGSGRNGGGGASTCASTNMDTLRQVFRSLESSSLGHGVSADVARSVLICAGFDESACDEILDEDEALNLMRFEEVISALEERSKAAEK